MLTQLLTATIPSPADGVWHIGPVPIRGYALCIILGIVVAIWIGEKRWQARGGAYGEVQDVAIWAVPFGLVGGRLYHVLTDWSTYFGDGGKGFGAALRIWDGGLGIWGAIALGAWTPSGSTLLMLWIFSRAWYFSESLGERTEPVTSSPLTPTRSPRRSRSRPAPT